MWEGGGIVIAYNAQDPLVTYDQHQVFMWLQTAHLEPCILLVV